VPLLLHRKTNLDLTALLYQVKSESRLWATQLKIAARGEVQILLAEVDAIRRDIAMAEGVCADLRQQVKGLQDGRREMQARMLQMVPSAELQLARAEASQLRGLVDRMQQEAAAVQQDKEQLHSSMQVRGGGSRSCLVSAFPFKSKTMDRLMQF
jgi:hypothetical protein